MNLKKFCHKKSPGTTQGGKNEFLIHLLTTNF